MKYKNIFIVVAICLTQNINAQIYSLDDVVLLARNHNTDIKIAKNKIKIASEQKQEAFTNYFPKVSATGAMFNINRHLIETEVNPATIIPPSLAEALLPILPANVLPALSTPVGIELAKNGVVGAVTAVQPVFVGGQIINGNKLAKIGQDVADIQLQMTENEVKRKTNKYFWQLVALKEKMNILNVTDSLLVSVHKDVSVAVKAGIALNNDLLQVELRQNEIESQRLKLNNGINVVKLLLAHQCEFENTDFDVRYSREDLMPIETRKDCDLALLNTAEYKLLTKQVEASELKTKIAKGKNMPSLAVGVGVNYHNVLNEDYSRAMAFVTLNIPISDWWSCSHAIKKADIERQNADN